MGTCGAQRWAGGVPAQGSHSHLLWGERRRQREGGGEKEGEERGRGDAGGQEPGARGGAPRRAAAGTAAVGPGAEAPERGRCGSRQRPRALWCRAGPGPRSPPSNGARGAPRSAARRARHSVGMRTLPILLLSLCWSLGRVSLLRAARPREHSPHARPRAGVTLRLLPEEPVRSPPGCSPGSAGRGLGGSRGRCGGSCPAAHTPGRTPVPPAARSPAVPGRGTRGERERKIGRAYV